MMIEIGGRSFEIGKKYKLSYSNTTNVTQKDPSDNDNDDEDDNKSKEEIHDHEKVVLFQYTFKPVGLDPRGKGQITTGSSSEVKIQLPVLSDHNKNSNDDMDAIQSESESDKWMSFKGTIATSEHTQSNEYVLTVRPGNKVTVNNRERQCVFT